MIARINKVPDKWIRNKDQLKYMRRYKWDFNVSYTRRVFADLGRRWNTKNRVRAEWRYTRLSIKSGEIGHKGPRVIVAFKPAVNSALIPRSVVSDFATFDRQSSIRSLFLRPVLSVPPAPKCPNTRRSIVWLNMFYLCVISEAVVIITVVNICII